MVCSLPQPCKNSHKVRVSAAVHSHRLTLSSHPAAQTKIKLELCNAHMHLPFSSPGATFPLVSMRNKTLTEEGAQISSFHFFTSRWAAITSGGDDGATVSERFLWSDQFTAALKSPASFGAIWFEVSNLWLQTKSCSYLAARRLHLRPRWCPTWHLWSRGRESRCWCQRPRSQCPETDWKIRHTKKTKKYHWVKLWLSLGKQQQSYTQDQRAWAEILRSWKSRDQKAFWIINNESKVCLGLN